MSNNTTHHNAATYSDTDIKEWFKAASVKDFPENGGSTVLYKDKQIAVFNFTSRGEWYASQNMCPHRMEMVLARGIIGDSQDEPKVSCPFHKKNFSLHTGECMSGDNYTIDVFPVKISNGYVYIGIPHNY